VDSIHIFFSAINHYHMVTGQNSSHSYILTKTLCSQQFLHAIVHNHHLVKTSV